MKREVAVENWPNTHTAWKEQLNEDTQKKLNEISTQFPNVLFHVASALTSYTSFHYVSNAVNNRVTSIARYNKNDDFVFTTQITITRLSRFGGLRPLDSRDMIKNVIWIFFFDWEECHMDDPGI